MKILMTSPYRLIPAHSGGAVRTINIAKALARLGHDVHVLGAEHPADMEAPKNIVFHGFRARKAIGHFINSDFRRQLGHILHQRFDLAIAGFPFQSWMLIPLLSKHGIPLVYDAHNVESDRFRRMQRPMVAAIVQLAEKSMCRAASLILTVSQEDRDLLMETYGTDSLVLANGVDKDAMNPGIPDSKALQQLGLEPGAYILFYGGYDYPPNVEAACFLLEQVWPRIRVVAPGLKLAIVGRDPQAWMRGHAGVVITSAVDDIANVIRGARVVLAPIFSGGGTRLKIIEALACGKNVLATPFGAMGIAKEDSTSLRLAPPKKYADTLETLINETTDDLCGNLAACRLADNFEWSKLVSAVAPNLATIAGH